ncbi:MAG: hypothetical protein ACR2JY_14235 [Chloroflexota bacterium]
MIKDHQGHGAVAWRQPAFIAVLLTYLALAIAYGLATPILESGDENWHEAAVWQISAGHGLPVLNPAERNHVLVPVQEAGQPPLYYLLAAAETFWIHPPSPAAALTPSPNANIGQPSRSAWHRNLFVHTAGESFPWHGLALAVHLQRLLSTLCGVVTVVAVYALAQLVAPVVEGSVLGAAFARRRVHSRTAAVTQRGRAASALPLLAMALVAFNPMFLFISGSVDNDVLAIALSSLILLLLVMALSNGATPRAAALTGTLVGLATLTKLSAAAIAAPALAVYLWLAWRSRSRRRAGQYVAALTIPPLLLSGWWFIRNWILYGDPLGLATFVQVAGGRDQALTVTGLLAEAPSIWSGFWGVFGIFDILLPAYYYAFAKALLIVAGLGLLVRIIHAVRAHYGTEQVDRRGPNRAILVLLGGWLLLEALLLVRWTVATQASSGRLLFPALGSVAVLAALGLVTLAGRWQWVLSSALTVVLALGGAFAIPLAIAPAYAAPVFTPEAALHPALLLGYRYGNLELVGATLPAAPLDPGSVATVTLFWATRGPLAQNYVVSVQLFGPGGIRVEDLQHRTDAFPGGGTVLTSRWPVRMGLIDPIPVRLRADVRAPSLVHIAVFVYPDGEKGEPVAAQDSSGQVLSTPEIGRLVYGRPTLTVPVESPPLAVFGDQIALQSANVPATSTAGRNLPVRLRWRALSTPKGAYTVFVHVGPPDQQPLAQQDQQPLGDMLPTTDWVAGEVVDDGMSVPLPSTLPAGRYDVYAGLYQAATGTRLGINGGGSQVRIGSVTVSAGGG